jgi:FlaG/FlaF family flagellin (archaellin)
MSTSYLRAVPTIALTIAVCSVLAACNHAEHEKQIMDLQQKADERVAKAERGAQEKVTKLEQQVAAVKAECAAASTQAKAQADDALSKVQASADEATKAAEAAQAKAREAYKEEGRTQLAHLNQDLTDVASKAAKMPVKDKAGYDQALKEVVTHQKEIAKDIAAFDQATLDTFKVTKAKLDRDLALMKAAVKTARSKLPAP